MSALSGAISGTHDSQPPPSSPPPPARARSATPSPSPHPPPRSTNDKGDAHDPKRVGRAEDLTRSDGGLGTYLVGGKGLKTLAQNLNRAKASANSAHDKRMRHASDEIRRWCTQINAPEMVLKSSFTLMSDILRHTPQLVRGKTNTSVNAAVFHWCCKMHNHPVPLKMLSSLARIETKVFNKAHKVSRPARRARPGRAVV